MKKRLNLSETFAVGSMLFGLFFGAESGCVREAEWMQTQSAAAGSTYALTAPALAISSTASAEVA